MSYSVVKADLQRHRKDIFSIWERHSPGLLESKYRWMYEDNPAGVAHVWMVKHDPSEKFVGVIALFPRSMIVNGVLARAGIVGDFLVDHEHRGAGPALMLQRHVLASVQDGTVDLIYGFPNKAAEPIVKRAGYRLLGERVRLVKTLKSAPLIGKRAGGQWVARLISPIADLFLRALSIEAWSIPSASMVCEEVNECDARFDKLWEGTGGRHSVVGERSSAYLNWKFVRAPGGEHRILIVRNLDNRIKGYIIYRRMESQVEIRDICLSGDRTATLALLSRFFRNARSSDVDCIVLGLMRNENMRIMLRRFGFAERAESLHAYLSCSEETSARSPSIAVRDQWWLLESDDDT